MTTHLAQDCFVFSKDSPSPLSLHIFDVFPCVGVLFLVFKIFLWVLFFSRRVGMDHFTFSLPAIH